MPQDQDRPISLEDFEEQRRKYYGIPSGLAASLRQQESGGNQYDKTGAVLTSPKQAKGRYQVLQDTADRYGLNASDPFENIEASFRYLSDLNKQVDKNVTDPGERWAQTLAGYHAGDGRLREVNKTGQLPTTSDGSIRTDKYVSDIMNRWQQYDTGQTSQAQPKQQPKQQLSDPQSKGLLPGMSAPVSKPLTGQERRRADDANARANAAPDIARMVGDVEALKREGSLDAARSVAAKIKRQYGKWMDVVEGQDGPSIKSKIPEWNPVQPKAGPYTPSIEEQRAAFEQLPLSTQLYERGRDALARGGGQISRMARQVVQAAKYAGMVNPLLGGAAALPQAGLDAWQQGEEARMQRLEEARQGRPSSFATDIYEGVLEGAPTAAAAIGGSLLTGGGIPAAVALGAGMGAAGADWRDPKRALTQTAINAVAPVVGGQVGSRVGGAVASRLASPAARALTAAGGELAGGAAGNVLGRAAETGVFEGRMLTPGEVAREATIGAAMNAPGAYGAGRAARAMTSAQTPTVAPDAANTTPAPASIPGLPLGVRIIRQGETPPPRARNERHIPMEITNADGVAENVLVVAPRGANESTLRTQIEEGIKTQTQQPQATEQSPAAPPASAAPVDVVADTRASLENAIAEGRIQDAAIELQVFRRAIKDQYDSALKAAKNNPAGRVAAERLYRQQEQVANDLQRVADNVGNLSAAGRRPNRPQPVLTPEQDLAARANDPTRELLQPLGPEPASGPEPTTDLTGRIRGALPLGAGDLQGRSQRLLGPASTQRLSGEYQGAEAGQETRQIPGVPRTIHAEDEPTAGLPVDQAQRRTAMLPRGPQPAGNEPLTEPTNRIATGVGDELPRQPSQRLEGQPIESPRPQPTVPRATPENIADLEARYEQMLRARYDKGSRLTGDLALEEQALGSEIYRYRNEEAQAARGNRFDPEAPPNTAIGGRQRGPTIEERQRQRAGAARAFATEEPTSRITEGEGSELRRYSAPLEGQPIELPQRGPRTSGLLQASRPGRPVTQEVQIPSAKNPRTDFYSREDARAAHFDTMSDAELVAEIRRLEDVRNAAVGGRLTPEQAEANRFDLKIAVEQQKERRRIQQAQGREPGERIAPRAQGAKKTPRTIQHEQFGEVTESDNQKGVPRGKLRVEAKATGAEHIIQNPRTKGNRNAAFVKAQEAPSARANEPYKPTIPSGALPELRDPNAPPSPLKQKGARPAFSNFDYRIPEGAMPELQGRKKRGFSVGKLPDESEGGQVLGSLGGSLQGLFKNRKPPKANPTKEDVESASLGKAAANVFQRGQNEVRALWTSMDFSAPFSQGAILTLAHPIKGAGSAVKMVRSLSRAQSDAIDAEIAFHPLRKLGEESGLYLATGEKLKGAKTGTEEAHGSGESLIARQIGFRHSERAYRTYLDTLRLATWESYVKALQADGHTFANNPKAFKDAAAFINIATGRGQLKKGGTLEKASDIMGNVLFAPRNMISNFQVLDPVRYASLAPGARKVVLKDAVKAFGVMVGTAALLKANGAQVSFNPEDSDFLTARLGNTRYDLTFGKKTQVQFLARLTAGLYRQATGEGNLPGKDPMSVLENFASNKLSPVLGTAKTFLTGKDATGEKVADKSKAEIAWETAAPMLWRDLVEAYREEGKAGVVKTLPAIVGARVNTYPDRAKSDWIETPSELRAEQKRFGEERSFLTPKRGEDSAPPPARPVMTQIADIFRYQGPKPLEPGKETPGQFAARKALADEWNTKYGRELVTSDIYRSASPDEQKAALAKLKETIAAQSDEKRPNLRLLNSGNIIRAVREAERNKKRREARSGR